jgi:hypothetical protein
MRAEFVAQMEEHLPRKYEALIPSNTKNKKRK